MITFRKNVLWTLCVLNATCCFAGRRRLIEPVFHKHYHNVQKPEVAKINETSRIKTCTLKRRYIDAIWQRKKTVEGRLNKPFFKSLNVQKGDTIWFNTQSPYGVLCAVTEVKYYAGFEDMLKAYSFKACVPEATTFEEALAAYRAFYSKEEEKKFGVIAWHVTPISTQKPQTICSRNISKADPKRLQNRRRTSWKK